MERRPAKGEKEGNMTKNAYQALLAVAARLEARESRTGWNLIHEVDLLAPDDLERLHVWDYDARDGGISIEFDWDNRDGGHTTILSALETEERAEEIIAVIKKYVLWKAFAHS
jgi:hypothetical protein